MFHCSINKLYHVSNSWPYHRSNTKVDAIEHCGNSGPQQMLVSLLKLHIFNYHFYLGDILMIRLIFSKQGRSHSWDLVVLSRQQRLHHGSRVKTKTNWLTNETETQVINSRSVWVLVSAYHKESNVSSTGTGFSEQQLHCYTCQPDYKMARIQSTTPSPDTKLAT